MWNIWLSSSNLKVSCETVGKILVRTQLKSVCRTVTFSVLHRNRWGGKWMMHTDKNIRKDVCPDVKMYRFFKDYFETVQTLLCVYVWVCEVHKIPVWIFGCFFLSFLLYRIHKWEQQTSSFIPLFSSLDPLFPFPSSLSGQVRLDSKLAPK